MPHACWAGCRRPLLLAAAIALAALVGVLSAAPADAHHRCGHKGRTCTAPPTADTTPPDTAITAGPSGTISSSSASFSFTSTEAGSFDCRLDSGSWTACSSPTSYSGLSDAAHTFEVRAKDLAGNLDPTPALRSFTVQTSTTTDPAKSTTRPVGSAPLSDAEAAARVHRSAFEPRPENATANQRVPSAEELAAYRAANAGTLSGLQHEAVTGNFRGTTDEIIQWAAWKWGFDEDVFRAVAAVESWWVQGFVGDAGKSFGLMQIKATDYPGTHPLSSESTAFNADYYGALMRYYYDGKATWLNDPCCYSGTTYVAGDLWGSIGAHYSGRWYTASSVEYINKVKDYLGQRIWAEAGF